MAQEEGAVWEECSQGQKWKRWGMKCTEMDGAGWMGQGGGWWLMEQ